ncbi:hypothetical protein [Carboxylicivirga linearis]|uniref:Peptidyl-prolyl cis-trans isomerase n=1 Tax=Carboxylicivirga linearis TaxID=1628157 RepID=A0ABS5JT05_9BACT|nr:hypothetical protein [Carboxylicivirga linearis]MBS2098010.1 hypothetical protein [Carboxylicivirga linearis]
MRYSFQYLLFTIITIGALFQGCQSKPDNEASRPLVSVGNRQLTIGMVSSAVPNHLSAEDSIVFVQDYINRWIRSELLLRKAELNLNPKEKNVEQLLEEYRRSLLIHKYQQKLLAQKFTPFITSSEIKKWYEDMEDNFRLEDVIIKGVFVTVPKTAPNINTLEKLYRSDDQEDLVKLETYCFQNAKKYEIFLDQWLPMEDINIALPEPIKRTDQFVKYNKFYKTSDSLNQYFLSIKEYKLPSELAPIEYVEEKIKAVLVNKKRLEFLKQLENDLYEEGLDKKSVKFY